MKNMLILFIFVLGSFIHFSWAETKYSLDRDTLEVAATDITRNQFEQSTRSLYTQLGAERYNLNYEVFRYAYIGYKTLKQQQRLNEKEIFSIIDFTQKSNNKRFYTIDLNQKRIIYNTYVSHGRKSGDEISYSFSDVCESHQSSIGFYITGNTYNGSNGFSLQLHGDEKGYNSNIAKRGVVIHTADYANESYIAKYGRLGRSFGCPVLPENIYKDIIETIKNKTVIFAYYNDPKYLSSSKYLKLNNLL